LFLTFAVEVSDENRYQDERLIKGFLAGEPKDHTVIKGWISTLLRHIQWVDRNDQDDIQQDVLVKLMLNLQAQLFKFECSLKTYVSRIAKYSAIDYLRVKTRKKTTLVDSFDQTHANPGNSPEKQLEDREKGRLFFRIMKTMSKECLNLWKMIFNEKLTYRKMAAQLNIPEGTVKRRVWECKQRAAEIRKKFEKK